jgi:hypothetical protein
MTEYIDLISEHLSHIKTCDDIRDNISFDINDYPLYTINGYLLQDSLTSLIKQHAVTEYKISYLVYSIMMEGICQNDKLLDSNIKPHLDIDKVYYDGNSTFKEFYDEWDNKIMYRLYEYYSDLYGETSVDFRKILTCILMPTAHLIDQIKKLLPEDIKIGTFLCEYMYDILYK